MKAILFDLGHTLIDYYHEWRWPEAKAVSEVFELASELCEPAPDKERFTSHLSELLGAARERKIREMIEVPLTEILVTCFNRFGCEPDEELMERSLRAFYQTLLETRELVPGAVETLEGLKSKGVRIGLVSDVAWGLPSTFPVEDMRHFGMNCYFDDMVFSTDVGLRKPNPRIFKIALFNLGVGAEEAAFVGNSLQADIRGARSVSMMAILKESKMYVHDDDIVPDARIGDWSEFES